MDKRDIGKEFKYVGDIEIQGGEAFNADKDKDEDVLILTIDENVYVFGQDEMKRMIDAEFTKAFDEALKELYKPIN